MPKVRIDEVSGLMLAPGFLAVLAVVGYAFPNVKMNGITEWVPVRASAVVAYPNDETPGRLLLYLQDVDEPFLIVDTKDFLSQRIAEALTPDDGTL